MNSLRGVKQHLNEVSTKKKEKKEFEWIFYICAKEFGISYNELIRCPIPYLISLIECLTEMRKLEEAQYKKK